MKKELSTISKNVRWNYGGSLLMFLVSPLLLVILTRALPISEYGVYVIIATTIGVLGVLLDLGFSQYIISHFPGKKPSAQASDFVKVLLFVVSIMVAIVAITIGIPPVRTLILSALQLTQYPLIVIAGLCIIFFLVITRLIIGYLTAQKHFVKVNIILTLSQALWILLVFGYDLIMPKISIIIIMYLWLVGCIITLITGLCFIWKDIKPYLSLRVELSPLRSVLTQNIPIMFFVASSWIMEVGDRYLINYYLGKEAVAHYALGYSLLGTVSVFGIVIIQTLIPYISTAFYSKKSYDLYVHAAIKYSLLLIVPATVGFYVLRNEIITLTSGAPYAATASIIPFMILFPLFFTLSFLLGQLLILRKRNYALLYIYLFGALLNLGLNVILIPLRGIIGAALATMVSYCIVFILLLICTRQYLTYDPKFVGLGKIIGASVIMGIAIAFIHPQFIFTKLTTILLGAGVYGGVLILSSIFSPKERDLIVSLVPDSFKKTVRKIVDLSIHL